MFPKDSGCCIPLGVLCPLRKKTSSAAFQLVPLWVRWEGQNTGHSQLMGTGTGESRESEAQSLHPAPLHPTRRPPGCRSVGNSACAQGLSSWVTVSEGLPQCLPPGPESLPDLHPALGLLGAVQAQQQGVPHHSSQCLVLRPPGDLGHRTPSGRTATPACMARTCSEDEGSTRTWQRGFAWPAGGRRQHGAGGRVGRQGSPLGARWNSTSFSGHTTAKGKEKGKEEVRREAQRRCRLVRQRGLCLRRKEEKEETWSPAPEGLKQRLVGQAHTSVQIQRGRKNFAVSFTNTEYILRCLSFALRNFFKGD